ncbi:MAG: hypothetical protein HY006_02825 [Candidatus Sungbacteria bacterium]|nr:hypothetical protein [Candidatus Sungbacteria bacterium]
MDNQTQSTTPEAKPVSLPNSFVGGLDSTDVALPHYRRSPILLTVLVILLLVLLLGAAVAFGQRFSVQSIRSLLPASVRPIDYVAPSALPLLTPLVALEDVSAGDSLEDIESDISQTYLDDLDAAMKDLDAQAGEAE